MKIRLKGLTTVLLILVVAMGGLIGCGGSPTDPGGPDQRDPLDNGQSTLQWITPGQLNPGEVHHWKVGQEKNLGWGGKGLNQDSAVLVVIDSASLAQIEVVDLKATMVVNGETKDRFYTKNDIEGTYQWQVPSGLVGRTVLFRVYVTTRDGRDLQITSPTPVSIEDAPASTAGGAG